MAAQMPGCPFYGHRWPERSPQLRAVRGNECGLDFERHGPCLMEQQDRNVDYFACPVALDHYGMLTAARFVILFETSGGPTQSLNDWESAAKH